MVVASDGPIRVIGFIGSIGVSWLMSVAGGSNKRTPIEPMGPIRRIDLSAAPSNSHGPE